QLGRHIVSCDPAKQVTITKKQRAEFRLANMDCISEHCLENGFQLGGRTADDLQHLGCRALLLPRLGEFTSQAVELFLHIGGRGTATARGSGLLAAFELRRLTVAHFSYAPFVAAPAYHRRNRCTTSGRFSWSPSHNVQDHSRGPQTISPPCRD